MSCESLSVSFGAPRDAHLLHPPPRSFLMVVMCVPPSCMYYIGASSWSSRVYPLRLTHTYACMYINTCARILTCAHILTCACVYASMNANQLRGVHCMPCRRVPPDLAAELTPEHTSSSTGPSAHSQGGSQGTWSFTAAHSQGGSATSAGRYDALRLASRVLSTPLQ